MKRAAEGERRAGEGREEEEGRKGVKTEMWVSKVAHPSGRVASSRGVADAP